MPKVTKEKKVNFRLSKDRYFKKRENEEVEEKKSHFTKPYEPDLSDDSDMESEDPFPGKAPIKKEKLIKYSRVEDEAPSGIMTKYHRIQYSKTRKNNVYAVEQTARSELLLLEESGYVETKGTESTLSLTQKKITDAVDITSQTNYFDLKDPRFGPYTIDYTRDGRHLLVVGRKGYIAAINRASKKLIHQFEVREETYAVKWLHREDYFAVAQKKWTYLYDTQGIEMNCFKKLDNVLKMEFLPKHFLLATANSRGFLSWVDITTGEVHQFQSKRGRLNVMCQNPYNAVIVLGHSNGVVTLWSPKNGKNEALASMLCHKRPVTAVAVDSTGTYMATAAVNREMKIWDLRNSYECLQTYRLKGGASKLEFSQKGLLAANMGNSVYIYKDCCKEKVADAFMLHRCQEPTQDIQFCPYEDALGIGHLAGFTQIIVPGSAEANFDALECNLYQTKKQRNEAEVKALLEKIPIDMISLDPTRINQIDLPTLKEEIEKKKKLLYLKPTKIDFEPRPKKKGRSGSKKDVQRKKGVQELAKLQFVQDLNSSKLKNGEDEVKPKKSTGCLLTDRFKV